MIKKSTYSSLKSDYNKRQEEDNGNNQNLLHLEHNPETHINNTNNILEEINKDIRSMNGNSKSKNNDSHILFKEKNQMHFIEPEFNLPQPIVNINPIKYQSPNKSLFNINKKESLVPHRKSESDFDLFDNGNCFKKSENMRLSNPKTTHHNFDVVLPRIAKKRKLNNINCYLI